MLLGFPQGLILILKRPCFDGFLILIPNEYSIHNGLLVRELSKKYILTNFDIFPFET